LIVIIESLNTVEHIQKKLPAIFMMSLHYQAYLQGGPKK